MLKKFIIPILASLFIFVGCSTDDSKTTEEQNKTTLSTSYKDNTSTDKTIIFSGKSYSNNKYAFLGNLLFFPDSKNNEKLSVSNLPQTSSYIDDNSIIDRFDYNINSITTDGNYIYFSSISNEAGLYKLDYEKKEITKLNNDSILEMICEGDKLYYINSSDKKIYSYSIKDNQKILLSNSKASNLIYNNNSIFYKNLSDSSKLYSLRINNSNNFKITDLPVESFVIYNNEILFSNSSDNNYLYSLDTTNSEAKKLLNISSSNLKQFDEYIYFINNENPNSLYQLVQNTENNNFNPIEVYSDFINNYYTTEKGIFLETAINLNEIKIINYK